MRVNHALVATRVLIVGLVVVVAVGCEVFVPPRPGEFLVRAMHWPACRADTDPLPGECQPRNVRGATVVIMLADGSETVVAEGRTDHDGRVHLDVPAGTYLVVARGIEGLASPEPALLEVAAGVTTETALHYTSGLRVDNDGHP